jgi:hypothetical protein
LKSPIATRRSPGVAVWSCWMNCERRSACWCRFSRTRWALALSPSIPESERWWMAMTVIGKAAPLPV